MGSLTKRKARALFNAREKLSLRLGFDQIWDLVTDHSLSMAAIATQAKVTKARMCVIYNQYFGPAMANPNMITAEARRGYCLELQRQQFIQNMRLPTALTRLGRLAKQRGRTMLPVALDNGHGGLFVAQSTVSVNGKYCRVHHLTSWWQPTGSQRYVAPADVYQTTL